MVAAAETCEIHALPPVSCGSRQFSRASADDKAWACAFGREEARLLPCAVAAAPGGRACLLPIWTPTFSTYALKNLSPIRDDVI